MNRVLRTCGGLAALTLLVTACGRTRHPERDFQAGLAYFKQQKYAKAASCFERAARAVPGNAQALNFLGVCQLQNGQPAAAVATLERALQIDETYEAARYNLALAQLDLGHTDEAIALLRLVVRSDAAPADAAYHLGLAYLRASAWAQAGDALTRYRHGTPNSVDALNAAGLVNFHLRDYQQAAHDFSQAIAADPRFAPAYLNLAILEHHHLGRKQEALDHYQKYLDLAPRADQHEPIRTALAQIARELAAQAKPAPAATATATAKPALSSPATALTSTPAVVELIPPPPPKQPATPTAPPSARPAAATVATAPAPPAPPLKKVRVPLVVASLKPGNRGRATAYFNKGVRLQQQGDLPGAIAAYDSASAADPSFAAVHYNQAIAYRANGRPDKALDQYELALRANPDYTDARFNYAILLQDQGFIDDAIAQYERILQSNPDDAAAHLSVASLYTRDRTTLDKARQHYQTYTRLAPNSALTRDIRRWLEQNP